MTDRPIRRRRIGRRLNGEDRLRWLLREVALTFGVGEGGSAHRKEGGAMKPEEAFGTSEAGEWGRILCLSLLRYNREIRGWLQEENQLLAFQEALERWKESYLGDTAKASEEIAEALFRICEEHGVIRHMIEEELVVTEPERAPRGAMPVRGRGETPVTHEARDRLRKEFEAVAKVFE